MIEQDIQREILGWLSSQGIFHWRVSLGGVKHGGVRKKNPMAGHPDIAGIIPNSGGRYFAIEVKKPKEKAEEHQVGWLKRLHDSGCLVFVARSLEDVQRMLSPPQLML